MGERDGSSSGMYERDEDGHGGAAARKFGGGNTDTGRALAIQLLVSIKLLEGGVILTWAIYLTP